MERKWWGAAKVGRKLQNVGPFATRDEAYAAARKLPSKAKEVSTGYGEFGPSFDIRWERRVKD